MNEQEERTLNLIKEIENTLAAIQLNLIKNQPYSEHYIKLSHSLQWINANLDKEQLKSFLDAQESEDFEFLDIIFNLLDDPMFDLRKYH